MVTELCLKKKPKRVQDPPKLSRCKPTEAGGGWARERALLEASLARRGHAPAPVKEVGGNSGLGGGNTKPRDFFYFLFIGTHY